MALRGRSYQKKRQPSLMCTPQKTEQIKRLKKKMNYTKSIAEGQIEVKKPG